MLFRNRHLVLTSTGILTFILIGASCGDGPTEAYPPCEKGEFKIQGTLDGMKIDIKTVTEGGGFSQGGGGEFGSQSNTVRPDAARPNLLMMWAKDVDDGSSTAATGHLVMPLGGPLAGETLCLGAASRVGVQTEAEGGALQFKLAGLTGGAGCTSPRAGTLLGCWR